MIWKKTILVVALIGLVILAVACQKKITSWVPSLENFRNMPYKQILKIRDLSGSTDFEVTVASHDESIIKRITVSNFSLEMLPLEDSIDLPLDRSGAGVVVDDKTIEHKDHDVSKKGGLERPSPVFIKVHALVKEEPPRFRLNLHNFPQSELSVVVNAGHYKSIVLRRYGSGYSYARFYHHHGDGNLHVLYEGWFYRCTYAYDCYPNHSVPSWWTSKGDESVEFRADCYGRCP